MPISQEERDALARFDENIARARHLIEVYEQISPKTQGRKSTQRADLLRAAIVFIHASLEDLIRSICTSRFPLSSASAMQDIPVAGTKQKKPSKFSLGDLVPVRRMTVDQLLMQSVRELFELTSFSNVKEIMSQLNRCQIAVDASRFNAQKLEELIHRRHNIVHRADHNDNTGKQGKFKTKSIGKNLVTDYLVEAKNLKSAIEAKL
jgi:hypothetical protein